MGKIIIVVRNCLLFLSVLLIISCEGKKKSDSYWGSTSQLEYPLVNDSNIVITDQSIFGETELLKGEQQILDLIIKTSELDIIRKDNYLLIKHLGKNQGEPLLHILEAQSLNVIAGLANRGDGPDQFTDIRLIETNEPNKLCYIMDMNKDAITYVDKKFKIHPYHTCIIPKNMKAVHYSEGSKYIGNKTFLFNLWADDGYSLFSLNFNDSIAKGVMDLAFDKKSQTYASAYLGESCSNLKKKRLAYAYGYYHRVVFSDLNGEDQTIIQFEEQEPFRSTSEWEHMNTGKDIGYYVGCFGSSDYVYFIYRGHDWADETFNQSPVLFLEQWTWKGEPVKRYQLEKGMNVNAGCVDEENQMLYLLDKSKDDFLFKFQLMK